MKAKPMKLDIQKESSDNYAHVVARLGNRHRIILCRNGIQRIIQRTAGNGWTGFSYHTDVVSLTRRLKSLGLPTDCTEGMGPL